MCVSVCVWLFVIDVSSALTMDTDLFTVRTKEKSKKKEVSTCPSLIYYIRYVYGVTGCVDFAATLSSNYFKVPHGDKFFSRFFPL